MSYSSFISPPLSLLMTSAYAEAGVDIAAGQRATALMKDAVKATYGPEVLTGIGAFGGLFDVSAMKGMESPTLVASTDGVGTKTKVAAALGRWDTLGFDIVNHCTNDILVQGAQPLFFLDYVASSKLEPERVATIVRGIADACKANGMALLGGETAEMPGVYESGEIDLVGTVIGVVDRPNIIDGSAVQVGDAVMALPSVSPHTNGYTLLRNVLGDMAWDSPHEALGESIGEALLRPHRSYLSEIAQLREAGVPIHGLAHITGGGMIDNLPRIFADGIGARIERGTWPELPIFGLVQRLGGIKSADMFHAFNMGVGMLVVLPQRAVTDALNALDEAYVIGETVHGAGVEIVEK